MPMEEDWAAFFDVDEFADRVTYSFLAGDAPVNVVGNLLQSSISAEMFSQRVPVTTARFIVPVDVLPSPAKGDELRHAAKGITWRVRDKPETDDTGALWILALTRVSDG